MSSHCVLVIDPPLAGAEKVRQPVLFMMSVRSVWFLWFIWFNQIDEIDEIDLADSRRGARDVLALPL